MANPQIVYNAGGGLVTMRFNYPPRSIPAYECVATRYDNLASSGVRESILVRVDNFLELSMETVLSGADVAAWNQFMQYALTGGQFAYYPDSSLSAFTDYWLEGTNWKAGYKAAGIYTFKMKFRQVVA
jgi:hypothetical protein